MQLDRNRGALAAAALFATILVAAACSPPPPPPPPPPSYELVTTGGAPTPSSLPAVGVVHEAATSADGAWAVFSSYSEDVVPGDPGPGTFLRDMSTATITRVSAHVAQRLAISADGGWIALQRVSDDHVPGFSPVLHTVEVHERATGTVHLLPGGQAASILSVTDGPSPTVVVGRIANPVYDPVPCQTLDVLADATSPCPAAVPPWETTGVGAVSRDGRHVAILEMNTSSGDSRSVVWDRQTGALVPLSRSDLAQVVAISDGGATVTGNAATPSGGLVAAQYDTGTGTVTTAPTGQGALALGASRDGTVVQVHDGVTGAVRSRLWDTTAGTVRDLGSHADPLASTSSPNGRLLSCSASLRGNHVTDAGAACLLTTDDLVAADTNSTTDAYLAS